MVDFYSIVGWLGAVAYVVAYFLLSRGYFSAHRAPYHILNVIGGACLITNAIALDDMPNLFVNLAWAGIAAFTTLRIVRARTGATESNEPSH